MKKVLVALTAVLTLGLCFGAGAQARCGTACLNHRIGQLSNGLIRAEKRIASLSQTVSQQAQTIASQQQAIGALGQVGGKVDALYECLFEVPITQFGAPEEEGYLYENPTESFKTTALDVPFEGELVDAWFLIDGCNFSETAGLGAARALAPAADLRTLLQPRARRVP